MTKEQFNRDAETRKYLSRRLMYMKSRLDSDMNDIIAYNPNFVDSDLFDCICQILDAIEYAIREIEHNNLIYTDTDGFIQNVDFDLSKFFDLHKLMSNSPLTGEG